MLARPLRQAQNAFFQTAEDGEDVADEEGEAAPEEAELPDDGLLVLLNAIPNPTPKVYPGRYLGGRAGSGDGQHVNLVSIFWNFHE